MQSKMQSLKRSAALAAAPPAVPPSTASRSETKRRKRDGAVGGGGSGGAGRELSSSSVDPLATIEAGGKRERRRVLVLASRGINARYRHLMEDLKKLLPHHKKDVKFDAKSKSTLYEINEIAEMKSCETCLFFETRKRQDFYLWLSLTPNGPSARFQVHNVHTMDELKMTGNCLNGSRAVLSFDAAFERAPHWRLMKEMLTQTFATPEGHPKTKPFIDHAISFSIADSRIWVRHYQISDAADDDREEREMNTRGEDAVSLVEIGPRFVLEPIRVFDGSFGGPTLFQNRAFVTPNEQRRVAKREHGESLQARTAAKEDRARREDAVKLPPNQLAGVFR